MTPETDELSESLHHYSYEQALLVILGSTASGAIMTTLIATTDPQPRLWAWFSTHVLFSLLGLLTRRRYIRSSSSVALDRARLARRVAGLLLGLIWGLGGLWWPLSSGDIGVAMLLCTSGLAAAGSSTSAADPVGLILFTVLAYAPRFLWQEPGDWWLSALLSLYVGTIILVGLRNHRLLKASLSLRWANAQLLDQARAEQGTALSEKQRAETAVASRTRFLAAASHDLRQPVQAISLFADVLAQQTDEAKRAEAIAAVGRASRALSAMLESLLDISRLDAGVVAPAPLAVPILRMLEDTAAALQDEAERRDMVVQVAGRACRVWADRTMLERVIQNLASNAVRHGAGRVLLASRLRGDRCLVQVWDQGPGIPEADRARIFDEFVQLANRERDRTKGLGLGLAMVQRICELNDWPLTFDSRVGHGTVFTVHLPTARTSHHAIAARSVSQARAATVLLVEDDPDVREATSAWLLSHGCKISIAGDASEAIKRWHEAQQNGQPIDILVTDQGLPGSMSGAELALHLRNEQPDLPVVMMTGAATLPFGESPPLGIVVMRKPVRGDALWQTMQTALDAAKHAPPLLSRH